MTDAPQPHERRAGGVLISTDPRRLDIDAIHAFLTRSYWSPGVPRETVAASIAGSLPFGVYDGGWQIGFARVITDRTSFAYLADVYLLESHRGRGLGRRLMDTIMSHPDLQRLRRFVLVTRDANRLYERVGFQPLARPDRYMEITRTASDLYGTAPDPDRLDEPAS